MDFSFWPPPVWVSPRHFTRVAIAESIHKPHVSIHSGGEGEWQYGDLGEQQFEVDRDFDFLGGAVSGN